MVHPVDRLKEEADSALPTADVGRNGPPPWIVDTFHVKGFSILHHKGHLLSSTVQDFNCHYCSRRTQLKPWYLMVDYSHPPVYRDSPPELTTQWSTVRVFQTALGTTPPSQFSFLDSAISLLPVPAKQRRARPSSFPATCTDLHYRRCRGPVRLSNGPESKTSTTSTVPHDSDDLQQRRGKYCPGFLDCWSIKSCPIVLKFWEAFKDSWIFNLNGGDRIPTVQS
ncbi:hypothetical protein DM860_014470 [Cuscuta australis]|uniref:Uncharacterized protein n=1 Tax=Cuscuta australis TaxID=267555 RepID=A0A328E174_9ASTE|nr:hypothetical protein DM860_014470 [Cuscuta australis]